MSNNKNSTFVSRAEVKDHKMNSTWMVKDYVYMYIYIYIFICIYLYMYVKKKNSYAHYFVQLVLWVFFSPRYIFTSFLRHRLVFSLHLIVYCKPIEEGWRQQARQRSSRLFWGQNLLNSLPP